jgi:hypothetical protein
MFIFAAVAENPSQTWQYFYNIKNPMKIMRLCCVVLSMLFCMNITLGMAGVPSKKGNLKKECRQYYKKLKAEGWEGWSNPEVLQADVNAYFSLLEDDGDMLSIIGQGTDKDKDKARRKAEMNAKSQHAHSKGGTTSSHFVATEKTDGTGTDSTTLVLGIQSNVSRKVELPQPSLRILRKRPDGLIDVQLYYLLKQ